METFVCPTKEVLPKLPKICADRVQGTIYENPNGFSVKWNGKRLTRICIHGKYQSRCVSCDGSDICIHNKRKTRCTTCGGSDFCVHGKRKTRCLECGGSEMCKHKIRRMICKECEGSMICKHGVRVTRCLECGGSETCKNDWCNSRKKHKYEGYCYVCFLNNPEFKEREIVRNYKNKERAVAEFIMNQDETKGLSWVHDKMIDGGCSKRRPDLLVDLGTHVVILEIDEQQHNDYDTTCEQARNMSLWEDVQCRPITFIRFNPDKYTKEGTAIPSCWTLSKKGLCILKQKAKKDWSARLTALKERVLHSIKHVPTQPLTTHFLFYDM